jgi:fibronectin type 3 domain-containing protein
MEGMRAHERLRQTLERLAMVGALFLFGASLAACGAGAEGSSPEIVTSAGPTGSTITVAWDPVNDPSVQGYNVYYGTASRQYQTFANAGPSTTYTVANLQRGTTYYFAVTAYNSAGESAYSEEVSATP